MTSRNNLINNLIQLFIYLRAYATIQGPIIKQARAKMDADKHTNKDKPRNLGQ
jgi:hypothetical protein